MPKCHTHVGAEGRQREREMRRFKSPGQAQRFLSVHGVIQNLFRVGGHQESPRERRQDTLPNVGNLSRNLHYGCSNSKSMTLWIIEKS